MSFDIAAHYVPERLDLRAGIDEGMRLLRLLGETRRCGDGWFFATPKAMGDEDGFDPLSDPDRVAETMRGRRQDLAEQFGNVPSPHSVAADQPGAYPGSYRAELHWHGADDEALIPTPLAMVTFDKPHEVYGMQTEPLVEVIKALLRFRPAQHVSFYYSSYRTDHWPLDRQRFGIGWMGWVPFALSPADLPSAARVEAVSGGSLILSNADFWLPENDPEALRRAQATDRRLNELGMLPTDQELFAGNWGQG